MTNAPPPPDWSRPATFAPGSLPPAGFWIRVVAAIIDSLVLCVAGAAMTGVALGIVFAIGGTSEKDNPLIAAAIGLCILGFIVMNWLYEALLTASPRGATLGKRAIGARIVKADGTQLSFGRATARYFAKAIITPLLPFGLGYMLAGWTRGKRALHDMVADTLVIRQA